MVKKYLLEFGKFFSWGGGNLGQKEGEVQDLPRRVEAHTENRIFTDIFPNKNAFMAFASSYYQLETRVMSLRPDSGPSSGNSLVSILGTGLYETEKQKVRFSFSKYSMLVDCIFDSTTNCFSCVTPDFDNVSEENIEWPQESQLEMTLDGVNFYASEQTFMIYC